MRKPLVSGQFYEAGFEDLDKQIRWCYKHKFGPGKLPSQRTGKRITGIVSPHAGYSFSGPGAAWAFKEIAESSFPDLFVLLGLSHSGFPTCISLEDWETPFGIVKNDGEFGKSLAGKGISINENAHSREHSIEVQLPFLQFVNRNRLDDIRICPIIASEDMGCGEIAERIADALKDAKKRAIIIASSDFTHYGFSYGYVPFTANIRENMYKLDKGAIEQIIKLSSSQFLNYTDKTGATICGRYPIAVCIEACKLLGAKKARLLQYYTSGDVIGDYGSAVGYGSLAFY